MLTAAAIEPVFLTQPRRLRRLEEMALEVAESAARLSAKLREPVRGQVAELTRWMHCYYSNLIEGQQTRVRDIEAALVKDFSSEPAKRDLQQLSLAHLEVQRWAASHTGSPFAAGFLRELHRRFFAALPESLQVATLASGERTRLIAGELRDREVTVGAHLGPPWDLVPGLLDHFQSRYESNQFSRLQRIIAVGASHHRLAWIHPFRDGNGRVVRLFSDTLIRQLGIEGGGLWSFSRGLARNKQEYYARLANADQERSSSNPDDGRGHLSELALGEFCEFSLRVMIDQVKFMEQLLELDTLEDRISRYVHVVNRAVSNDADRVYRLLRAVLLRGEIQRGEAGEIVGAGERTGRAVLKLALEEGLLTSDTPKGVVRLAFPSKVHETYFPELFPAVQATASTE